MKDQTILSTVSREVIRLWNEWEIRGLVLLSLTIQVVLIFLGSQRKLHRSFRITAIVWSSYIAADWVATVALGNLAKIQIEDYGNNTPLNKKYILQGFWAPFLLLHLGGPDTITAHSLEENELWLRHLLTLFVETAVSAYVLVRSWTGTYISFIATIVLVIGFFKYGERIYVLWSASTKKFKDDLITSIQNKSPKTQEEENSWEKSNQSQHCLIKADSLFNRFQCLFANLILQDKDRTECYDIITKEKAEDAFRLVAIELGFLYDVLYTKATLLYSRLGICLHCTIVLSTVTALVVFSVFVDVHEYHDPNDITVTYLLLGGAACQEVLAFFNFLLSDRTTLWLVKQQTLKIPSFLLNRKRWTNSMVQYNLLDFCLKEKIYKLPNYVLKMLEEYLISTRRHVKNEVMEAIYGDLKARKLMEDNNSKSGNNLAKTGDKHGNFDWCTVDLITSAFLPEFHPILLVWHIATDILYHLDFDEKQTDADLLRKRKISKYLSEYMLYLLLVCPSMLPQGVGEIMYRDTCAQVTRSYKKFLAEKKNKFCKLDKKEFCKLLYDKIGRRPPNQSVQSAGGTLTRDLKYSEFRNQSVLSYGCTLARQLKTLEFEERWGEIGGMWINMLVYAARHCRWREHAQQLWKGGELLTHVSLLMAHLGLK